MSGPGPIVVKPVGSSGVTAPSSIAVTVGSAIQRADSTASILSRIGKVDIVSFPSLRAMAIANGVDFQHHLIDGSVYLTGPRAPYTAPTIASTADHATATLTPTGNPNDGDYILVGDSSKGALRVVYFKATLDTSGTFPFQQVKKAGSLAATITNLVAFINNTYTQGTDGFAVGGPADVGALLDVRITSSSSTDADFTATTPGTVGNTYDASVAGLTVGGTFGTANKFTGGTAGTGTAPPIGTYGYGYANVRKADNCQTAISNLTEITTGANANITADNLDTPATRDGIDLYRLFRTVTDGSEKFRVADSATDPITDDKTDAAINDDLNVIYEPDIVRPYGGGYPTRYRFHAVHLGAMFGTGAYISAKHGTAYDSTTAAVTNAALTVTLSGGTPKTRWIGRNFRVTTQDDRYLIVDVNETTKVLTLNQPYRGTTDDPVNYEVSDDRNANAVGFSVPELLNNWPVANQITGITSEDPRGNTGIRSMWGSLIVWTWTGTWRILGDPSTTIPRVLPQADSNGCYTNRAVVDIGGSLMWIGPDGVFLWDGTGNPVNVGKPRTNTPVPLGIETTIQRINPLAVDGIVANYNPSLKIVRWAVPVDSSLWNNYIIQYNVQTGAFTFDYCDGFTAMENIVGPSGSYVTIAGDFHRRLWQLDNGLSGGAYGFECVQTVTGYASATNTITVSGTPFPTSNGGLAGCPVGIIGTDGTIQRLGSTCGSNTSSTIKLVGPPDTAPVVGNQIVVGALYWRMKSSKFSLSKPEIRKTVSTSTLHFDVSTGGQVWCAAGVEDSDPTCKRLMDGGMDYADLTATKGTKFFELARGPGRTCQVEYFAIAPGFELSVIAIEATFRTRDEVKR